MSSSIPDATASVCSVYCERSESRLYIGMRPYRSNSERNCASRLKPLTMAGQKLKNRR